MVAFLDSKNKRKESERRNEERKYFFSYFFYAHLIFFISKNKQRKKLNLKWKNKRKIERKCICCCCDVCFFRKDLGKHFEFEKKNGAIVKNENYCYYCDDYNLIPSFFLIHLINIINIFLKFF